MPAKIIANATRRARVRCGRGEQPQGACRNGAFISRPRFAGPGGIAASTRAATIMAFSLFLLACAGKASAPHIGQNARPDNRIALASQPAVETTWRAKDLTIHYRAVTAGENLNISGFVEFGPNLAKYPMINGFRVYLHFLNAEGVVLDSKLLWATGIKQEVRFVRWTFERQWPLPPDTVAVGFSYRGAASEAGGKGNQAKTGWEVYQAP